MTGRGIFVERALQPGIIQHLIERNGVYEAVKHTKLNQAGIRIRIIVLSVVMAAAAAVSLGGCGSDSSTGPEEPVGKYPLTGTAVFADKQDHSGIKVKVQGVTPTITTGPDGSFTLPPLGNGDYTLEAGAKFYSTLTTNLQVRDSLLVDPIGQLELTRTFFIEINSDSLRYTHESDSVVIWITLRNEDVRDLELFNPFARPYDFAVYDPAEQDEEVWRWSDNRPQVNEDKVDFEATIAVGDSLRLEPHKHWDKTDQFGTLVPVGTYEVEGEIFFFDSLGRKLEFDSGRREIKIAP